MQMHSCQTLVFLLHSLFKNSSPITFLKLMLKMSLQSLLIIIFLLPMAKHTPLKNIVYQM